ncbi:hypothetical protein [Micromonospora aurantiaca (nom. illeg.)]|uniref:hypothetical protein n=1 Tax=Micromonospora aurantiaca (nom. illeg.) TaxID=47850 RepID=UPI0033FB838C
MDTTREQAIAEVMAETGEPYEIVAELWDALVSMQEEEQIEAADDDCDSAYFRPVVTVELPGISR